MASLMVVSIPSHLVICADTYKSIQNRKSQGQGMEKTAEELCTLRSNNSTIRRFQPPPPSTPASHSSTLDNCPPTNLLLLAPLYLNSLSFPGETAELLCEELSDDEGTYQAHDIYFDTQRTKGRLGSAEGFH